MEAAALYAFAESRGKPVICVAHVTNQMARIEGDFEKGDADGSVDALTVTAHAAAVWRTMLKPAKRATMAAGGLQFTDARAGGGLTAGTKKIRCCTRATDSSRKLCYL
jgi:hypothetical protein